MTDYFCLYRKGKKCINENYKDLIKKYKDKVHNCKFENNDKCALSD